MKVAVLMGSSPTGQDGACRRAPSPRSASRADVRVLSAHRTPARVASSSPAGPGQRVRGVHLRRRHGRPLASAVAAQTTLPVVGVPLSGGALDRVDALYSTVQMPMYPGRHRGRQRLDENAALLVVQMLAITDADLAAKLADHRREIWRAGDQRRSPWRPARP